MKYTQPLVKTNVVPLRSTSCSSPVKYTCNGTFKCSGSFSCTDSTWFKCAGTWNV